MSLANSMDGENRNNGKNGAISPLPHAAAAKEDVVEESRENENNKLYAAAATSNSGIA